MGPEERDRIVARLLAAWPRPPLPDETLLVWHDHLSPMTYDAAVAGLTYLEKNAKHRPSLSEFHEAYASQRQAHPDRALTRPDCGVCDDGWVDVRCAVCACGPAFDDRGRCPAGPGCLARCPNGCMPMSGDERAARDRAEDDRWRDARKRRNEIALDLRVDASARVARDPSGPNRDDDAF